MKNWCLFLVLMLALALPVITIDNNGRLCWTDERGSICLTVGDAMGIAHRIGGLP